MLHKKITSCFSILMFAVLLVPITSFAHYTAQKKHSTDGITLYMQPATCATCSDDYILEIDLAKANLNSDFGKVLQIDKGSFGGRSPKYKSKSISNGEFKTPDDKVPFAISSAAFGGNYPANFSSGYLTFPVRKGGFLETEGFGDPQGSTPDILNYETGAKATPEDCRILCVNNEQGYANILPYYRLDKEKKCPDEWVSFSEYVYKRDTGGKTFVGLCDTDKDNFNERILIFTSEKSSRKGAAKELRNNNICAASEVMQFDGGGSSQLWVKGTYLVKSSENGYSRPVWNAFVISKKQKNVNEKCKKFSDIESKEWYCPYVETLHSSDIIIGKPDGYYHPKDNINRAEFLKMSLKAAYQDIDFTPPAVEAPFADVPKKEWFAPYVLFAKENGMISGYADNTFRPGEDINRAEAVKILINSFNIPLNYEEGEKADNEVFHDVQNEKDWFYPYVYTGKDEDIIEGYKDGYFYPAKRINRAEAAKIVCVAKYGLDACNNFPCCEQ